MMINFRKTSVSFQEQMRKLFRNEKKFRKSGLVEEADFDFQITDNGFNVDTSVDMDTSVVKDLTFNKRLSTKFWMMIWLYSDCDL